jgi:hypothetical protein
MAVTKLLKIILEHVPPQLNQGGAALRFAICPQSSPNLNPIEMPFSKLKASLRKAAERTIPRLRRRIARFACTLTLLIQRVWRSSIDP